MRTATPFRFLHAADLHLDSPFSVHQGRNEQLRRILLDASLKAFVRLCDLAIEKEVDFVVLAGDVYDGIERGARAELSLRRQALRLAEEGIKLFIAFGNHDPMGPGGKSVMDWPENVICFPTTPETHILERNGEAYAEITGISYETREEHRNLAILFPKPLGELFSIAVLHCNVGGSVDHGNYAPCSLEDLTGRGYDYWALGHIHSRTILSERPLVVYPGNIQGLHMKPSERGPKGVELVEVSERGTTHSFVPLSELVFDAITVDVSDRVSWATIADACVEAMRERRELYGGVALVSRIQLVGTLSENLEALEDNMEALHQELALEASALRPEVFVDQVSGDLIRGRGLEQFVSLSDVIGELEHEIGEWRKSPNATELYSVETELRKALVSRLKRAGFGASLNASTDDLESAEGLLVEIFTKGAGL